MEHCEFGFCGPHLGLSLSGSLAGTRLMITWDNSEYVSGQGQTCGDFTATARDPLQLVVKIVVPFWVP